MSSINKVYQGVEVSRKGDLMCQEGNSHAGGTDRSL